MSFDPVFLWTDRFIFLLVGLVLASALYIRRHEHLREPWGRVLHSRMGMVTAVILGWFVLIGLLDSMHYNPRLADAANGEAIYATEVRSVFDRIMDPVRLRVEKTYSAPFATHLFTKEAIELADGSSQRDYPRLKYGGSHLVDPDKDKAADIAGISAGAVVEGAIVTALIAAMLVFFAAWRSDRSMLAQIRRIQSRESPVPWRWILGTLLTIIVISFVCFRLGSHYHIFGTDKVGQDVFYQALKSARTGLVIGTLATLIMLPIAIFLGIAAGYFRGWVDDVVQYIYTLLGSIPGVLLIAAAILIMQVHIEGNADNFESLAQRADVRLLALCAILGLTSWTGLCRLLRGEALKLREIEYIQAADAFGVSRLTIIFRHMLPNVMHIVLISIVLDFSGLVLAEAVLSYINIGVDPSTVSWGNMINSARLELARDPVVWWSLAAAFVFMFTLVLSANLFSDAVRDAFDPRLRIR